MRFITISDLQLYHLYCIIKVLNSVKPSVSIVEIDNNMSLTLV